MSRPNIIFYFSDQQRWDTMGCYGQKLPITPNLDRMAAEGTRFDLAFSCQPVCGPARACIQSGLYATQAGVPTNGCVLKPGTRTLADYFNEAGYDTAYVGKWHLASCRERPIRTLPVPEELRGGYRYWMAADALEHTSHGYDGYVYDGDNVRHDFVGHRIDCINAFAIEYLQKHVRAMEEGGEEKPFFLFVSQLDPHHQNDHNRYEGPHGSKKRFAEYEVPGDLADTQGDWRENYPDYLGQCNLIDQNIGKLRDALEDLGLAENTIILYTTDHGSHFRTRNREYKRSCHEASIRIPMIAWGPGFMGGRVVDDLVSLIDVAPTLLDCAGIDLPPQYMGHSLKALVAGQAQDWPQEVFSQISEMENGRSIRTRRWKYAVQDPNFVFGNSVCNTYREAFLYDLDADPHEKNNLIADPAYQAVRDELRPILLAYMAKADEQTPTILPA